MRLHSFLISATLFSFLVIQGANALALNQQLSQGFHGLENQAGPATYTFTIPENASYLFAGILIKEGSPSMELQDSSGYSYGTGESVIVEDAKPGAYTLTVSGSGKYTVFWDYMQSQVAAPISGPSLCEKLGDSCREQAKNAVSLNFPVCTDLDKGLFGFFFAPASHCNSAEYTVPSGQTRWFIVDASKVTVPQGFSLPHDPLVICMLDYMQGGTGGAPMPLIYPIDSDGVFTAIPPPYDSKIRSYPMGIAMDNWQGCTANLPASLRYLVKITETGAGVPLTISYR